MFSIFNRNKPYEDLGSAEFEQALKENSDAVIIDVRTPQEFQSGKIPGALNYNVMDGTLSQKLSDLDPNKHYFLYCRSGGRSGQACGIMANAGFTHLVNLKGGMMGWRGKVK